MCLQWARRSQRARHVFHDAVIIKVLCPFCRYCFVQNLKDQGLMNDAEFTVLTEWFDFIQEAIPLQVDGIGELYYGVQ